MISLYKAHKCGLLIPLLLLIGIDILAFIHITGDLVLYEMTTRTELLIFTISLTLTYYYICKNNLNINIYLKWLTNTIKGKRNEFK